MTDTRLFRAATLALLVGTLAAAPALSDALAEPTALCAANPDCSRHPSDESGGVLFKIRGNGGVKIVRCEADGNCARMYPKGRVVGISDLKAVFAAK